MTAPDLIVNLWHDSEPAAVNTPLAEVFPDPAEYAEARLRLEAKGEYRFDDTLVEIATPQRAAAAFGWITGLRVAGVYAEEIAS